VAAYRVVRVLLVEDNPDDIEIARRAFKRRSDVQTTVLRDGQEVLDAFCEQAAGEPPDGERPDMILLDLNLPRVNGFEVLERVRAEPSLRAIPVVVLTASAQPDDVLRAYQLGANSYIQKPVSFQEFSQLLEVVGTYWLTIAKLPYAP